MRKGMLKDLEELSTAGILDQATCQRITEYYQRKEGEQSHNWLYLLFGTLGGLLIGLGLILIIAHNWAELGKTLQTVIAFLPLVIGHGLVGYTLWKKRDSLVWTEATGLFTALALAACMALVGQIYHLPGEEDEFILTWMLMCLPLVYILRSSAISLLYLFMITQYCSLSHTWFGVGQTMVASWIPKNHYWWLFLLIVPFYYWLSKLPDRRHAFIGHHWAVAVSLLYGLWSVVDPLFGIDELALTLLMYMGFSGLCHQIGRSAYFEDKPLWQNPYLIIGSLGAIVLMLSFSFTWIWENLQRDEWTPLSPSSTLTFLVLLYGSVVLLLIQKGVRSNWRAIPIDAPLSLVFLLIFIMGAYWDPAMSAALLNLLLLSYGILYIYRGAERDHLGLLNYGLLIVLLLTAFRFFDEHIPFWLRGVLFVAAGLGFLSTNILMFQKRQRLKTREDEVA